MNWPELLIEDNLGVAILEVASKENGFDMDNDQISWFGMFFSLLIHY